jgi:hypothetical protein
VCFVPTIQTKDLSIFELTDQAVKQVEIDRVEETRKLELANKMKKESKENNTPNIKTMSDNDSPAKNYYNNGVIEEDDTVQPDQRQRNFSTINRQQHQTQNRLVSFNHNNSSTMMNIFEDGPSPFDDLMDDIHQQGHDDTALDNNNNIEDDIFNQEHHYSIIDDDPIFGTALEDDVIRDGENNDGSTIPMNNLENNQSLATNTNLNTDGSSTIGLTSDGMKSVIPTTTTVLKKKIKPNFRSKLKK